MKRFAPLALLMMLAACESTIQGQVKVLKPFDAKVASYSRDYVRIVPGTYNATVHTNLTRTKFSMATQQGVVEFRIPGVAALQRELKDGRIYLPAAKIGQTFDIDMTLSVKEVGRSGQINDSRQCVYDTYTTRERVCGPAGSRPIGSSSGYGHDYHHDREDYECWTETRTHNVYGSEDYWGYNVTQQRFAEVKLIKAGVTLATMKNASDRPVTSFVETGSSACRRY